MGWMIIQGERLMKVIQTQLMLYLAICAFKNRRQLVLDRDALNQETWNMVLYRRQSEWKACGLRFLG